MKTKRDQARELTTKVNGILKTYNQNKSAGVKHSFEYLRWVKNLMIERDNLWAQC